MSRKSTQTSKVTKRKKQPALSLAAVKTLDEDFSSTPPLKKFKPLTSVSKLPTFLLHDVDPQSKLPEVKCNGREKSCVAGGTASDDQLWLDMYEPLSEADLAVHKRKVEDVRRWLNESFEGGPSGKLRKYRRVLILSGPAGTAKTATLRVLSSEMGFEILEWKNTVTEEYPQDEVNDDSGESSGRYVDYEAAMEKFQVFIARASTCRSVFSSTTPASKLDGPSRTQSPGSSSASGSQSNSQFPAEHGAKPPKFQIILLEDLPNILHAKTQDRFYAILESLVYSKTLVPVVIIVSDAGLRGEGDDEGIVPTSRGKEALDARNVIPPSLLKSQYLTEIRFNPIAPTLMRKALQALVTTHFASAPQGMSAPSKEVLDIIVESSNGDIRSAVMALQFACILQMPQENKKSKRTKNTRDFDARALLEVVTRREHSLALFHLLGKVLYNKRKYDPPNPSATAKDIQREKDLDDALKDPPKLPSHLIHHHRRASRVDVDTLYADSPIDSSLLSLYLHQNYTQFCNELDECDGVADWLSWVDSSGGEQWYQTNPHSFHLLALGTLHSLPSPVTRRSQQIYKSDFFENLKRTREAQDGVGDVMGWLNGQGRQSGDADGDSVGRWGRIEVVTELGAVLKARDDGSRTHNSGLSAPPSHRFFSNMVFTRDGAGSRTEKLAEDDTSVALEINLNLDDDDRGRKLDDKNKVDERRGGGWLEDDDIEDPD